MSWLLELYINEHGVLPDSVCDDNLSSLVEFNDHEKTHMHYHLRQDADN